MNSDKTFEKLATEYMEVYAKINKKIENYQKDQKMLDEIILKRLGCKKLEEITADDICQLHHELRETPYMANRVLALLGKMFNLALRWKWGSTNPVEGGNKYEEQKQQHRGLNDQELQRLFSVVNTYPNQSIANAIRLLLLTGSRRSEVFRATWDQFDLDNGVWIRPTYTTKPNTMKHVSLVPQAIELLKHMKVHATSPSLFPAPFKDIKKAWEIISVKADIPQASLRDLRYTHVLQLAQVA